MTIPLAANVQHLSAAYYDLTDFTGVRSLRYQPGIFNSDAIRLQALVKKSGSWSQEDWTDADSKKFCFERANERVEQVVLMMSEI